MLLNKFKVTHGWQNIRGEWTIALEGYGCLIANNKEVYDQAIKDGYLEIEIEDYPNMDNIMHTL